MPEPSSRPIRDAADAYVAAAAELNPLLATMLGLPDGQDRLPDFSPAGQEASDKLVRATLGRLSEVESAVIGAEVAGADERRCARLLRERLETDLLVSAAGENLRSMSNIFGPVQRVRSTFLLMPAASGDDWAVIAARIGAVPGALDGYRASLAEGASRDLFAAPRQVETVAGQLADWLATGNGRGWFADFAAARQPTGSSRVAVRPRGGQRGR